jgi:hypothetical protein
MENLSNEVIIFVKSKQVCFFKLKEILGFFSNAISQPGNLNEELQSGSVGSIINVTQVLS